jgi:hypothetical protein
LTPWQIFVFDLSLWSLLPIFKSSTKQISKYNLRLYFIDRALHTDCWLKHKAFFHIKLVFEKLSIFKTEHEFHQKMLKNTSNSNKTIEKSVASLFSFYGGGLSIIAGLPHSIKSWISGSDIEILLKLFMNIMKFCKNPERPSDNIFWFTNQT